MTKPNDFELLELATPYALHAISDAERAEIDERLSAAPTSVATAFTDEVRAVRETMALVASANMAEPPDHLRSAILALTAPATVPSIRQLRWRTAVFAAAAAVAVGIGVFGVVAVTRPTATVAEQVLAAPDVRTVSGPLGSGTATVTFSRDRNAGVLVMDNVPPPQPGTVYQMWLIGADGATSAGTMDTKAVSPTTRATLENLGRSTALAFTVEPGSGSPQPTTPVLAKFSLG